MGPFEIESCIDPVGASIEDLFAREGVNANAMVR